MEIPDAHYDAKDLRQAPQVTVPLKARKVPEGVKVTLSCSISGKPYPSVKLVPINVVEPAVNTGKQSSLAGVEPWIYFQLAG